MLLGSDIQRIDPDDFRGRLTLHYLGPSGQVVGECQPNDFVAINSPLGGSTQLTIVCTVPTPDQTGGSVIKGIRINARAHARKDQTLGTLTTERAAASGTLLVDRFRLELVQKGL